MKNSWKIIVLIIVLAIVAIGLSLFLYNSIVNESDFNFKFSFGESKKGELLSSKTYEPGEVKNISIDYDCGDIVFEDSETDIIKYEIYGNENKDIVTVNTNDGNLDITVKTKNEFSFFGFGSTERKINIYLPQKFENNIKIKNDAGDTTICNLENATLDIDADAGDINIGKIKNLSVKCDCGDIKIKEVLNKCNIKADFGNIVIDKLSIKEDSSIKNDCGNIEIKESNDINIKADVDLGNKDISKNNSDSDITLKIDCDCGNVKVK